MARNTRKQSTPWHLTPAAHASYLVTRAEAQARANATGYDQGVEANDLFKTWRTWQLPAAQHRSGFELRCEVVHPERATNVGHGHDATADQPSGWVHGAMGRNGRGIYHETAAGKHDMVIHQGRTGAWRIDLVTSKGGTHTDVTGPNKGYGSAEEAFQAALDEQHVRGIRGKSHVYIADRDGNLTDYEPMQTNGRRTGILSDGTRINVYHDDSGSGDPWTVVPHGMEWDRAERGGMRQMLGMSETATGISQWTEGQEGRHLGRSVAWDAVPENIKRHIERRVVGDGSMVANGSDGTWAFTEAGRVWVPEQQFDRTTLPAGATIESLRGYGHTMAVMRGGECLGWIVMDETIARDLNSQHSPNARRKKGVTVDDLPVEPRGQVLACPSCHAEYSAAKGDYFTMPHGEVLACSSCEVPFVLRRGVT